LRVWDAESCACEATLEGHSERVWSVASSPDGVSGSCVRVWSGACVMTLEGHSRDVSSVAFSPTAAASCLARGTALCGCGTPRAW